MRSGVRRPLLAAVVTAVLTAGITLFAPAQPAMAADTVKAVLHFIKCFDESESFSDEPFVERWPGQYITGWSNVDGDGSPHYFLSVTAREHPFSGSLIIDLKEDDGHWSEDDYLGTFWIQESEVNQGVRELEVNGSGYRYILQYWVVPL